MECRLLTYRNPFPSSSSMELCLDDGRAIWLGGDFIPPDSSVEWWLFTSIFIGWMGAVIFCSLVVLYGQYSPLLLNSPLFTRLSTFLFSSTRSPFIGRASLFMRWHNRLVMLAAHDITKALDLVENIMGLKPPREGRMAALDGFRVAAIIWVMANHLGSEGRVDVLERLPSAEPYKASIHNDLLLGPFFGNSALGVEVFLVLGMLLSARSFKNTYGFGRDLVAYMVRRSLRLWLTTSSFLLVAFSPQLRAIVPRYYGTMCTACGWKGVLAHLSFSGNLQSVPTCLGYLWYLGLDAQLHLLIVPALFTVYSTKTRTVTFSAIAVAVTSSMLARGLYCMSHGTCNKSDVDIPFIHIASLTEEEMDAMYRGLWYKYSRLYFKVGPFLLAAILGIWEKENEEITERKSKYLFWGGLIGMIATVYSILPEYRWPDMDSNVYNVLYTSSFRTVFSACLLCTMASFMLLKEPAPVHWSITALAKLSFCAYLVHMPAAYVFNYNVAFQQTDSAIHLLFNVLPLHIVLSFALALVFFLFVEAPLGRLGSIFLKAHLEKKIFPVFDPIFALGWQFPLLCLSLYFAVTSFF